MIDQLLFDARQRLSRIRPEQLDSVIAAGGLVIDTRTEASRREHGELPGAIVIERNVLEWRLDPASPYRITEVRGPEQTIVVVCDEGYASSLAAATLQDLGCVNATDLMGGYDAWTKYHHLGTATAP